MEGEKTWHLHGGSNYLPAFDMVDYIPTVSVASLAEKIQPILEQFGLVHLLREDLQSPLVVSQRIPTILTDTTFTEFDALFYWED